MADVFVSNTKDAVQYAIVVPKLEIFNDLNVPITDLAHKFTLVIHRVAEPQNSVHVVVGNRIPLQSRTMRGGDAAAEFFTVGNITLTGAQVLAFVQAVVDKHKPDGLTATVIADSAKR